MSGFIGGVLIAVDGGYKRIDEVVVGDMVLTHRGRYRRVYEKIVGKSEEMVEVSYIDGAWWYSIGCDGGQEFLVFDKRGEEVWKKVEELGERDMVVGIMGDKRVFYDLHYVVGAVDGEVYRLLVEDDGSYTIMDGNIAVRS